MHIGFKIAVGFVGFMLGVMGLRWMFAPEGIAGEFGLTLTNMLGLSTARADLGGLFVACSIMCFLGLRAGARHWLFPVALVMLSIALGRTIGLFADGFEARQVAFTLLEIVIAAVFVAAATRPAAGAQPS